MMQALQFDYADPAFPVSLIEVDEPAMPDQRWARIAVGAGGICGSDLHLFSPAATSSPTLVGIAAFPFVLGHEITGTVIEAGADCQVPVGTRVVVDPCIPCAVRGIDPVCRNCARGWTSSCLMLDSGVLTGGRSLGYTQGLGGGWADQVLAHSSMLHAVPDSLSDRAAVLHEPTSIAVHGLMGHPPGDGDPVLVVGAGIIGLAALAAVRGLFPSCPVTVLARHDHQAAAALACGADHVVTSSAGDPFNELARLSGSRVVGAGEEVMLMGGFPYVVEAVGVPRSVTEALRAVEHRGTVLLLGAAGICEVDLTPVWYKEASLVGSIDHTVDRGTAPGPAGAAGRHSIDRAVDILDAGLLPDAVCVTHEYPLTAARDAIGAALDKASSGAVKVVFRPG